MKYGIILGKVFAIDNEFKKSKENIKGLNFFTIYYLVIFWKMKISMIFGCTTAFQNSL